MSKKLFVVGTGTDVGKTYVTALIVKKMRESKKKVAYYKAAMSGNDRNQYGELVPGDAEYVKRVSGITQPLDTMCKYIYEKPLSPHLASTLENKLISFNKVTSDFDKLSDKYDFLTVEGSGGIICPLRLDDEEIWLEDFIKEKDFPCVLVADAGLGTINAVVLTVEYMKMKNISLKGIIFNNFEQDDIMHQDNLKVCEMMTGMKIVACVKNGDEHLEISGDLLESLYE
ncbi:MAG: dethiobiotin synthase [Eubacteriales bacterium]|nr:dethiobiotin synthase [Eubacteriales bacterium]MDY3332647.1 dethiobiotin synthase [Gallibacter sp.]